MKIIEPRYEWLAGRKPNGAVILDIITKAGRVAYQSEREGDSAEFVRSLIKRGHESVLEHAKVSVVVTCDRGISHEIVRHRIASYTQESTRYCNYTGKRFGGEIQFINLTNGIIRDKKTQRFSLAMIRAILAEWMDACMDAEWHYNRMIELGASPQIARSVLNNSLKTQIVITMNMREWRHFFQLRSAPDAHPQMREVADMLLEPFKRAIPVIFDDISSEA